MTDSSKNTDPAANDSPDVVEEVSTEASIDEASVAESPDAESVSPEEQQIQTLTSERDQFRDALQRLQADFENYRKRMVKVQGESSERANESLVAKILPVLDTLDLAKAHEPSAPLEQVSVALLEVLNKEGLERIPAVNAAFDPNLHEAVAHEAGDGESKVSEEFRAGYSWKGRVLRPSMVKVVG